MPDVYFNKSPKKRPSNDDYEDIASDDELMDLACATFGRVMRAASKDGWFTNYAMEGPCRAYGAVERG